MKIVFLFLLGLALVSGIASAQQIVQTQPSAIGSKQLGFTIASGGTFQLLAAANPTRKGCQIQNTSTESLYVFFFNGNTGIGAATLGNSFQLVPGAFLSCGTTNGVILVDNIAVTGATTGDTGVVNLN